MTTPSPRIAIVLAAGKGTRMRSELPKVLHPVAGRPMLSWVIDTAREAGCSRIIVVIGHDADRVQAAVEAEDVTFVHQHEQLGTGHALAQAAPAVDGPATLLVLSGDVPLVSAATLEALAEAAGEGWGSLAVADLESPGSLGRIVVAPGGETLDRIVEAPDATPEQLEITTINSGLYALPAPDVFTLLDELTPDNAKGELYLTDALGAAAAAGETVGLVTLDDPAEAYGANDRKDLVQIHRTMIARKLDELTAAGVTILDPDHTTVEPQVEVGPDTVLHPGVSLTGQTRIGSGCTLHQGAWLRNTVLDDEVIIEPYSVLDSAEVAKGCRVGPYARLRPGARLQEGASVGNFVEVKNSTLGPGVKAGHLSYLGDAEIGDRSNIGAGTVTCNYDGQAKHKTKIGTDSFIGSDTMLVAPVKVGDDATTAAGSVITQDVPDGSLAVGRAKQRTVEGWTERQKKKRDKKQTGEA